MTSLYLVVMITMHLYRCKSKFIGENTIFCTNCGKQMNPNSKFCNFCGHKLDDTETVVAQVPTHSVTPAYSVSPVYSVSPAAGRRISKSYVVSIIGAIVSFIIRIAGQDTFYTANDFFRNKKFVGLDADVKPLLTLIPALVGIIVSLLIVSDEARDARRKGIAFFVNAIFVILSLLCIWYDLPSEIIAL